MHKVLKRTLEASQEGLAEIPVEARDKKTIRRLGELRLIQSKRDIEEPEIVMKAEVI